jgi:iron complex outermembrane receptor protein
MTKRALWLASLAGLVSAPAITTAQDAAEADSSGLEEVVVTARKREENLQDVPLSITAFTADDIEARGLRGLADIAAQTPGFSFENYGGSLGTPVIRGQTQGVLTNPVQNVASFFNGVYLQKGYLVDASLLAVQQVEVLKGPQSALYGRNAFSGAVNYMTRDPTQEFEAFAEVTVGTDERLDVTGLLNLPLSDTFGLLISAGRREFDGTWRNDHPLADDPRASTKGNVGGYDTDVAYLAAQFRPTDKLTIDLKYSYADSDEESAPLITRTVAGLASGQTATGAAVNNMNCSLPGARAAGPDPVTGRPVSALTASTTPILFCGELGANIELAPGEVRNGEIIIDPRAIGYRGTANLTSLNFGYELSDAWALKYTYGKVAGKSLVVGAPARDASVGVPAIPFVTVPGFPGGPAAGFGYLRNGTLAVFDPGLPGTQVTFDSRPNGNLRAASHEFTGQFAGDGLIRSALLGAYYSDTEDREQGGAFWGAINSFDRRRTLSLNTPAVVPLGFTNTLIDTYVKSVYGSVEFAFSEAWRFTAEGRYTQEELSYLDIQNAAATTPSPCSPPGQFQEFQDNHFEPRVSLNWRPTADINAFVSGSKGYKVGGFNGRTLDASQCTYKPEENTTYEIGVKTSWLDRRLTANLTVYYIDWTELQQNVARIVAPGIPVASLVIGNIGDAEAKGAEFDGSFKITDAWRFDYGLSFADTTFASGSRSDRYLFNSMCDNIVCPANGNISGNNIQRSPKTKANLGLSFDTGLGSGDWRMGARLDGTYQSKQYLDEMNVSWVPDRTLLNAAVTLNRGPFDARLWVRNLTDEEYLSSSLTLVGTNGARTTSLTSFYGEQREVGLTLSYKFGD